MSKYRPNHDPSDVVLKHKRIEQIAHDFKSLPPLLRTGIVDELTTIADPAKEVRSLTVESNTDAIYYLLNHELIRPRRRDEIGLKKAYLSTKKGRDFLSLIQPPKADDIPRCPNCGELMEQVETFNVTGPGEMVWVCAECGTER